VVRQGLPQVVPEVPAHAQAVGRHPHKLALRPQAFEEEDELQPEEHHRVDARAAHGGVGVPHQVADEGEIQHAIEVAVEVIGRDQVLQRDGVARGDLAHLQPHHHGVSSLRASQEGAILPPIPGEQGFRNGLAPNGKRSLLNADACRTD
jgi:hypothetical protein